MSRENASAENVGHIKDSAEPMKQSAEKVVLFIILISFRCESDSLSLGHYS